MKRENGSDFILLKTRVNWKTFEKHFEKLDDAVRHYNNNLDITIKMKYVHANADTFMSCKLIRRYLSLGFYGVRILKYQIFLLLTGLKFILKEVEKLMLWLLEI